ncbi:uncharacterized protein LOC128962920 [Oppia nitens]|uniref:uncharacterized protein LOC128962920 n=1 Tax=Oppia nitens TaxID=1686743 RepID=UPI0023DB5015|nr:uncharacterized protein LOC128962920 [Oppia nitens]
MDNIAWINLFIPTKLFRTPRGLLFGYYRLDGRSLQVNITAMTSLKLLSTLATYDSPAISVLGTIDDRPVATVSAGGHQSADDDHHHHHHNNNGDRNHHHHRPQQQQHRRRQLRTDDNGINGNPTSKSTATAAAATANDPPFWCDLRFMDNQLSLRSCLINGQPIDPGVVTLVHYDTRDFMSSQLFFKEDDYDNRMPFVEFIIDSLKKTSDLFKTYLSTNNTNRLSDSHTTTSTTTTSSTTTTFPVRVSDGDLRLMLPRRLTASFIEFHYQITRPKRQRTHVRNKSWFPNQRQITNFLLDTVMMTTTGNQLRFRVQQFRHCWSALKAFRHKRISVSVGNVLSSVAIDIILGIITTLFLVFYSSPSYWLDVALKRTDNLVNEVQSLLNLLMGMPAGLKLNRPLNTALGQFFLYHIYLWKTYMIIIKPLFAIIVETLVYCGVLGFTCILSVLSDLVALATIHIYCFYGYAARLYGLQVVGLSALWRLFRGKKWNQLRSRVDSYSYGNDQLFIGTLSFTILLFLLPTVLMYYLVFLVLRVVTLSFQGALYFGIEYLSSMPIYMILLWIGGSKKVAARVSFETILVAAAAADTTAATGITDNRCPPTPSSPPIPTTVQLLLRTQKVPFSKVLSTRNDELQSSSLVAAGGTAARLSWSDFFNSVVWGKIIYPL